MERNTVEKTLKEEIDAKSRIKMSVQARLVYVKRHKPQHPHHAMVSPRGRWNAYTCGIGMTTVNKQVQITMENKISAFVYRNIRGCPTYVDTNCYKGLVRPIMEYTATAWDPHQQLVPNSLDKVQRRADRHITQDLSLSTSASGLVSKRLQPLGDRRRVAKTMMMYETINGFVDINPEKTL